MFVKFTDADKKEKIPTLIYSIILSKIFVDNYLSALHTTKNSQWCTIHLSNFPFFFLSQNLITIFLLLILFWPCNKFSIRWNITSSEKNETAYTLSTFEHVFIIGMSCFSLFSYATAKNILQEILQKIILYCVKNGLLWKLKIKWI